MHVALARIVRRISSSKPNPTEVRVHPDRVLPSPSAYVRMSKQEYGAECKSKEQHYTFHTLKGTAD